MTRRCFLQTAGPAALTGPVLAATGAGDSPVLGQGDFRYRQVPGWGVLDDRTPVKNCHGIVEDREGHLILFTDHPENNVIVYDRSGKLVHKWGSDYPGAHGLSIVREGEREVLYLTDLQRHAVFKTSLDGEVLDEWGWPEGSGKYQQAAHYRPSWTLHAPEGHFFVLDGYGRDYIQRFTRDGKPDGLFGGQEGGIVHWGPHGGIHDGGLLIAMSDQQYLLKLDEAGKEQFRVALPGGNPRQIQRVGDHYFVAHLADNWPADRNSRGFVSVLNKEFRVVSNVGGSEPVYDDEGTLSKMTSVGTTFLHPHDLLVASDECLYVAQFSSGNTYPLKFERV